jgi:hypothetical protein
MEKELTLDPNSYQALREANIARNEARLRALGLWKYSAPNESRRNTEVYSTGTQAQNHRRSTKRPRQEVRHQQRQQYPTRRSTRLSSSSSSSSVKPSVQLLSGDSTVPDPLPQETNQESSDKNNNMRANELMTVDDIQKQINLQSLSAPLITPPKLTANSARSMTLDVEKLLHGPDGLLGKMMTKTGKAFVMEESVRLAVSKMELCNGNISFNKYSGVQEWNNDAIFLWVNLHAPDSEVTNEFFHSGRHVTWFGGSRMHDATPAIAHLKRIGAAAAKVATGKLRGSSDGVVLWCRVYNATQKVFGAYICLGRLSVSYIIIRIWIRSGLYLTIAVPFCLLPPF